MSNNMQNWRLLDTGKKTAAENMCLDETILEARAKGLVPNTFRFLQFRPHCCLVGFHQSVEQEIREDYCTRKGILINRRITGGGAIYFGEDTLGWELIAGKDVASRDVLGLYRTLCDAAIAGLRSLGIQASFRPVNDIEVKGRKISGTGGTEAHEVFLFQGTLLIDLDIQTMLRALRVPTEKLKDKEIDSLKERMTCLKWELGEVPPMRVVKDAILKGFGETFGVGFESKDLTQWENDYFCDHLEKFRSDSWVRKTRRSPRDDRHLYSVHKAPGGVIRLSVQVDDVRDRIKMALITGDFFSYPKRAIPDLEASLKNCKCSKIDETVRSFFEASKPVMPGVTPDDFIQVIFDALRKRDLTNLGLTIKEANHIHMVNDAIKKMPEASVVLLPYCAKLASCEFRYDKDCISCGGCTVGVAYELARNHNMEPITIVDFEDLKTTLAEMKARGVKGYLGCCCDPFFVKHREDFEKAGMAGLLIDIENTSCYELDQERDAKEGRFKGETQLNLNVLEKVIGSTR
jgi:lipoate-protein ligase A